MKFPVFRYIYVITNLIDGKSYVGQHTTSNLNDKYFGSGTYLRRAIRLHGRDNFVKSDLYFAFVDEELNEREEYFIRLLKTHRSEGGYNITFGNESKHGAMKGRQHT